MVQFTCGRRTFGPENLDHWREDGTCSYCGSMHPDTVMRRAEAGEIAFGPTDKGYKAYIYEAVSPELMTRYETQARAHGIGAMILKEQGEAKFQEYWGREKKAVSGKHLGKFYFQHLSEGQRSHFIHLHNTRKMQIGFPGRFYVTPYFCTLDH